MTNIHEPLTVGRMPEKQSLPVVLTIAGFDPSSGAGVTADLKTFAALGVYGMACVTALTVQSTQGVRRVEPVAAGLVRETLEWLAADVDFAAIKIGMLATAEIAGVVAEFIERFPKPMVVLDPVMRSSSGAELLEAGGVELIRERLLGRVDWVTPNLDELAILTGRAVTAEMVPELADVLRGKSAALRGGDSTRGLNVVMTGGHLQGAPRDYVVLADGTKEWLAGERVETSSTHGTGCAHSSALAALLATGFTGRDAAGQAQRYVYEALRAAYPVGRGRGPMNHLWRTGGR